MTEPTANNQLVSFTERSEDHGLVLNTVGVPVNGFDVAQLQHLVMMQSTIAAKDAEIRVLREMHGHVVAMKDQIIAGKDEEIQHLREQLARAAPSTTRVAPPSRSRPQAFWDHFHNELIPQARSKEQAAGHFFDD
jgi:hypothetical protein